ncbi:MAG: Gfo/Idh/MocA family oxidoreductase [Acidimicrobiia bacterium]
MKAVIVGCGNIAAEYAKDLLAASVVDLVGFHDVDPDRAEAFAATHGGEAFPTLHDAIEAAELVINLTIFEAHYPVSKAALSQRRHVYSEKPVALNLVHALELAELSHAHGVRLAAAPFTFLGEAQQTALDWVRSGKLGRIRLAYAEVNHGRIETWHPNPAPFYAAGPMLDVGVYPLTIMMAAFGPVARLSAHASTVLADRLDVNGTAFAVGAPDYWLVELEHASGTRVRLTVNFYVKGDEGVEFHGDEGSLRLGSWFDPGSSLVFTPYEGQSTPVPTPEAPEGIDWSVGVAELVAAIEEGQPSQLDRDRSVHLVEILEAAETSANTGSPVDLNTSF